MKNQYLLKEECKVSPIKIYLDRYENNIDVVLEKVGERVVIVTITEGGRLFRPAVGSSEAEFFGLLLNDEGEVMTDSENK